MTTFYFFQDSFLDLSGQTKKSFLTETKHSSRPCARGELQALPFTSSVAPQASPSLITSTPSPQPSAPSHPPPHPSPRPHHFHPLTPAPTMAAQLTHTEAALASSPQELGLLGVFSHLTHLGDRCTNLLLLILGRFIIVKLCIPSLTSGEELEEELEEDVVDVKLMVTFIVVGLVSLLTLLTFALCLVSRFS